MSFVGYLPVLIVQLPKTVHLVVFPLAFIVPSILEVKTAVAVPLIIAFVALVPASLGYLLFDKLQLEVLFVVVMEKGQMRKAGSAGKALAFCWAWEVGDERRAHDWTAVASVHCNCA